MTDEIICAIGDIHGCKGMLDALLNRCLRHAGEHPLRLVFLGDYIDRGPDSSAVVEALIGLQQRLPGRVVCLRGNHEAILLEAATSGDMTQWLINGAGPTLASYGVKTADAIPADHLRWIAALPAYHDDGQRFFVHAGVNPERPLAAQHEHDMVWIREPFLSTARDYGRLIVHGHTPQRSGRPDVRSWRLNLDTAAVYGGRLTAAIFNDAQREPVTFLTDLG